MKPPARMLIERYFGKKIVIRDNARGVVTRIDAEFTLQVVHSIVKMVEVLFALNILRQIVARWGDVDPLFGQIALFALLLFAAETWTKSK